jgi:hypothetical protein
MESVELFFKFQLGHHDKGIFIQILVMKKNNNNAILFGLIFEDLELYFFSYKDKIYELFLR